MKRKLFAIIAAVILIMAMVMPAGASETPKIYINGQLLQADTDPVVINGRVMAPFRAVCEAMGLAVDWDGKTQVATAQRDGLGLALQVGIDYAYRNEDKISLDSPPIIINGRVMVPVRFIFENSGAKVGWDQNENTVDVATKEPSYSKEYAERVVTLVNEERAKAGLPALCTLPWLTELAELRAKEQFEYYGHVRPDGSDCFTVFEGKEYRRIGENVALGYQDPESVVQAWMDSEGHRENIMGDFEHLGVGVFIDSNGIVYWAQLFHK